jgi:23S rRNA (adenine2503-C2)-methyltransferase
MTRGLFPGGHRPGESAEEEPVGQAALGTRQGAPPAAAREDLLGLTRQELEAWAEAQGQPAYRGRQVFKWLYQKRASDPGAWSNLPKAFRGALAERAAIGTPGLILEEVSRDGTRKFLLSLRDGERIESVLISDEDRLTACISSQAGCALECAFCLTGLMGLKRNLGPGEIVGQVLALQGAAAPGGRVSHIVLMGMGEPLANFGNVERALGILTDPDGPGFSPRRVTLSTVGLVPGIRRLAASGLQVNLAISLSGTTDEQRSRLMPVNRRYPLEALLAACREYPLPPRRRITFEYVLMDGVNDTPEDARRLTGLLRGIRCKVNLLPLNESPLLPFRASPRRRVEAFQNILHEGGLTATIRESRGHDISAACGMLHNASKHGLPLAPDAPAGGESA